MAIRKLSLPADIDDQQFFIKLKIQGEFVSLYGDDHVNGFSGIFPAIVSALKIPDHHRKAYPGQPYSCFPFLSGFGDQEDGLVKWQKTPRPFCKPATQSYINGSGDKTAGKDLRFARIKDDCV